jgi:superfamily II DNA/RNA helicase
VLDRVPEGFIHRTQLSKRFKVPRKDTVDPLLEDSRISRMGNLYFDTSRLDEPRLRDLDHWAEPVLPPMDGEGRLVTETIAVQRQARRDAFHDWPEALALLDTLTSNNGYVTLESAQNAPEVLTGLLDGGWVERHDDLIFDPLCVGPLTIQQVVRSHYLADQRRQLTEYLSLKPGRTEAYPALLQRFDAETLETLLRSGGFSDFYVPVKRPNIDEMRWLRLSGEGFDEALRVAEEAVKIPDEEWEPLLDLCGDVLRPGAVDGSTNRLKVIARSYTTKRAARPLELRARSVRMAINEGLLVSFVDPEGKERVPAFEVEDIQQDTARLEQIAAFESVRLHDLALVTERSDATLRKRLNKAGINRKNAAWGDVRGRWELPDTYHEYLNLLETSREAEREQREAEREERRRQRALQREQERQQREHLRAKLLDAFPTWQHENRIDQHISLHIGPPNSGKTHDALERLSDVRRGWYLAPLRLLAYEVFDRLNQRGVPCNLLTGEEHIPVEGAAITAATIEMFNPLQSGDCVIIDEAQLLADSDRGWAWTRALLESQAPEMHVIGPPAAQQLIERLADAADLPLSVVPHERLAPIEVAKRHWPVHRLPPKTILVAFSRRMVLHLKSELEQAKRTVSVVYGGLPPEVRRRQSDRFAEGETDICVATDAVGMGLNLPADHVCFFEVEKYDGQTTRPLTPAELQQIGGRAGRYGIGDSGVVGATNKRDLRFIQRMFDEPPEQLTHARVAPTSNDLALLPGSLGERLVQWSALQSIPEALRGVITTTDLTERIELARMLTNQQVDQLGLQAALKLINAPTKQSNRQYWLQCAWAILAADPMPLPPPPPERIGTSQELEETENSIACADVYLWLSQRREFRLSAPDEQEVRRLRTHWSFEIDRALLHRLDTARRCKRCGRPLAMRHPYGICDECYYTSRYDYAY